MTFEHPWVLLGALLPAVWLVWEWRESARRVALALRAAGLAAVLIALAEPRLTVYETKVAAAILVDTSASVTQRDLAQASDLATRIESARGRRWTRVIPFARAARNTTAAERGQSWSLKYTAGDSGHATNLEAAIRDGAASLPAGLVPRVVLISDGNENLGSVVRAAWQARQLGVPVDTYPLAGRPKPGLRLESLSLPSQVFSGERFPIDISLNSPRRSTAQVEITAEGKPIGASRVQIEAGLNHFRVHTSVSTAGAVDLAGKISAADLGEARFEQAVTLRRPQALLITQDPPGTEKHLLSTLVANQFEVRRTSSPPPEDLSQFQLIIFNNWDLESLSAAQKVSVEDFVKQGGGLLWIGGERNVYVENKTVEDPVERALPAKLAPPRTPEGTCVVLIIDKSSSMEGKKMELARLASIGVIENLRPVDLVGVLIFDNSFQWTVPIRRAVDRATIKRLVGGITPDGGTQIAPALAEAYKRIVPANAVYKHIVLLTDGISEEGDSMTLARDASNNKVTISTVGLGQDVNRAYLEKIATFAKGKSYFLNDPSGLEQILLKDVMEHTGSTAVEKPVAPVVVKQAEILSGVGMETAPSLRGYVRFIAKPTAETILTVDDRDPLLTRWQYELGRAAVFASDAKNRWAVNWLTWPGFDKLWANLVRDLLPHATASEATASYDSANDALIVDYRLGRHVPEPAVIPDIYVFGPDGFQRPVKASKLAAGSFRVRLPIGKRQGLFRVRPLVESRAFPEIGLYRQEEEMTDYGSNEFVLRQISAATGGRFNPNPKDVFDPGGRSIPSTMELWPGLLALAVILNLLELVLRKGRSLFAA
ncbi:MAG TPA: VWA domain-containing protein [Bryobacteraceae bacterium]|nr:VWA domain-containing protein [Bryobacteraceae bacterium]